MTTIAGFILRATNRKETTRFYAELGLHANEHKHGGPTHHEVGPMSSEWIMEVYQRSSTFSQDALMLNVDSIEVSLQVIAKMGILPTTDIREAGSAKFVYITDPDGRPVMLIEKK